MCATFPIYMASLCFLLVLLLLVNQKTSRGRPDAWRLPSSGGREEWRARPIHIILNQNIVASSVV